MKRSLSFSNTVEKKEGIEYRIEDRIEDRIEECSKRLQTIPLERSDAFILSLNDQNKDNSVEISFLDTISVNDNNIASENSENETSTVEFTSSENIDSFIPSKLEQQVIQKSLAVINRSCLDDWNTHLPSVEENDKTMLLREKAIFYEDSYVPYELQIEVRKTEKNISCKILYKNEQNFKTNLLTFCWNSDDYSVVIEKNVTESSYIFFERNVLKKFTASYDSKNYPYWCDPSLADDHLQKI